MPRSGDISCGWPRRAEDREAACRLRFKVFNIEMGEGLESSYETGLDTDQFDLFCEHLLVEDKSDRDRIVGTYRMQSGETAAHEPRLLLRTGIQLRSIRAACAPAFWSWVAPRSTANIAPRGTDTAVARHCAVC